MTDEMDNNIDNEMRQLEIIAKEISEAQAVPLSEEEQAEYDEAARQESLNKAAHELADEEYTAAISAGIGTLWKLAAPNWALENEEQEALAQLTKVVIDKHCPNMDKKLTPEVMLGMTCLAIIAPRIQSGIPPRGKIGNEEDGGENEQD